MYQIISKADGQGRADMESFVSTHPKGHFLQSTYWPGRQAPVGLAGRAVQGRKRRRPGRPVHPHPAHARRLRPHVRPPRPGVRHPGHRCDARAVRRSGQVAKQCRGYLMQIDPDVLNSDEQFKRDMSALGFACEGDSLNFEGIQPRFVFRLDIAGKTEDEVLAHFEQKTRYNVRLAAKKGVTTQFWSGDGDIPDEALTAFADIMQTTGKRDRFLVRSKDYFANMLRALGKHARLYLAYLDGQPISGTIASQYGDKTWYMYGASSNEHRNVMPNYLLQWEMIRWAIAGGCRIYDFRGVSGDLSPDNPLYGLYRFKKGFNGDFCEFCGQFTMIYKPLVSKGMDLAMKCHKKLRHMMAMKKSQG